MTRSEAQDGERPPGVRSDRAPLRPGGTQPAARASQHARRDRPPESELPGAVTRTTHRGSCLSQRRELTKDRSPIPSVACSSVRRCADMVGLTG